MNRFRQFGQSTSSFAIGCAGVIAAVVLVGFLMAFQSIPAGHVGVVTSFGKVQPETLKPGLSFLMPLVNGVTQVDTRVRGLPFGSDDPAQPKFGAASKEYQDVFLVGTLNIHVDPNKAVDLFQNVGLDYDQKLVYPFFSTAIKEVVPKYGIAEILPLRETIRQEAVIKLQAKLLPYGIIVDDVAIANISFSEGYTSAIEEKQLQEIRRQTELQILEQRIIQANQLREQAKGEKDAAITKAEGEAEANRLLTESLSTLLIQYQQIIKLNPNVQVIYLPSDSTVFVPAQQATP